MKKLLIFALPALLLTACATASVKNSESAIPVVVPMEKKIAVALSNDGSYGSINYRASGIETSHALADALKKHFMNVTVWTNYVDFNTAKTQAAAQGFDYLIYPKITQWEDRNTPMSGRRDKVGITVYLVDAKTGSILKTSDLYATNNWLTFINNRPEAMLPKIATPYANALY
ncbi:hypothetical protein Dip510_000193 [Elusimicrobium posterum]|uniref:DUF4823 domain-containing protein n=1 Tax=Elusimicrobium posterum TaxID=3116653 RepID=UPI003C7730E3